MIQIIQPFLGGKVLPFELMDAALGYLPEDLK
jgi:hypothetical protein